MRKCDGHHTLVLLAPGKTLTRYREMRLSGFWTKNGQQLLEHFYPLNRRGRLPLTSHAAATVLYKYPVGCTEPRVQYPVAAKNDITPAQRRRERDQCARPRYVGRTLVT